ncbi:MAG: hypothetical protein JO360_14110, partial [Acidobacteria bacterium]|nr:hypothetical protein [Acidobacteriota bacterium]
MSLKEITARLLDFENHGVSKRASEELHALFSGIVRLSEDYASVDRRETLLGDGKALSPHDAARCILDYVRTRSFLAGLRGAVREALRRFPGETIHLLYAGCGPFAPLALPLTTEFTAAEVQFTLLDIHARSLEVVRQIVNTLGLSDYVRAYVQADATAYVQAREDAPHVIVAETMQRVLEKEPHVAVTANLAPQLRAGGILIPQKITLRACLADVGSELTLLTDGPRRTRVELGEVFELTAESSAQIKFWETQNGAGRRSPPVTLRVPELAREDLQLMILTEIDVF